jgi:hypothetical protein
MQAYKKDVNRSKPKISPSEFVRKWSGVLKGCFSYFHFNAIYLY